MHFIIFSHSFPLLSDIVAKLAYRVACLKKIRICAIEHF